MGIAQGRGYFDWNDLVTKYWPEFGKHGKDHITIADVMRHEAGLSDFFVEPDLAQCNTKGIKDNYLGKLIEDMKPYWKTERKFNNPKEVRERGYHGITRDAIANEIFRRVTGKTMGEFLKEEFPDIDVHTGCTKDLL